MYPKLVLTIGAIHFIYYINRLITTKVDSNYLGYSNSIRIQIICKINMFDDQVYYVIHYTCSI